MSNLEMYSLLLTAITHSSMLNKYCYDNILLSLELTPGELEYTNQSTAWKIEQLNRVQVIGFRESLPHIFKAIRRTSVFSYNPL